MAAVKGCVRVVFVFAFVFMWSSLLGPGRSRCGRCWCCGHCCRYGRCHRHCCRCFVVGVVVVVVVVVVVGVGVGRRVAVVVVVEARVTVVTCHI